MSFLVWNVFELIGKWFYLDSKIGVLFFWKDMKYLVFRENKCGIKLRLFVYYM